MRVKICLYSSIFVLLSVASLVNKAFAQCSGSDISASYSSKCLPALVTFYVSPALPKGSVYYWDLGDGNGQVLGADTIYHQYTVGGSYGVTATVIKPDGTKCIISKPNGFIVFKNPISPGFYASQTIFCSLPANIQLHDTTVNAFAWDWYINGTLYPNHARNITFADTVTGNLSITLIAYDNNGCSVNLAKPNYISVPENIPVSFCSVLNENTTHDQISAKFKIGFDTTGYGISELDWSFPSGNSSSYKGISPPSILYSDLSSFYNVSLTVKTSNGCVVTYTKNNLVGKYYSIPKDTLCAQSIGIINGIEPGSPDRYSLLFNIRADKSCNVTQSSQNSRKELVNFYGTGPYSFSFCIKYYQSQCYDTLVVPNLFDVLPPFANYSLIPNVLCSAPGKIVLNALNPSSVNSNSYTWEIFDSAMNQLSGSPIGPISSTDTSFTFSNEGVYSIRLIATNTNGCTDTIFKNNVIRVGTPDIKYKIIHDTLCLGDMMIIDNLSKMKDVPGNPLYYSWHFYNNGDTIISTDRSPIISFNIPGIYNLYFYVKSQYTCTAVTTVSNAIFVNGISGLINISGSKACTPVTYTLSPLITSNFPVNSPLTYFWSATPATGETILNPTSSSTSITFSKQGYYNILLKVSNGFCSTLINKDTFSIGTVADFTMDSVTCRNIPIRPINLSSKTANIFKWTVSPPSGFTIDNDTNRNPALVFSTPGCYIVTLKTSDSAVLDCYDSFSRQICISAPPVITNVYSPDTSGHCSPRVDSFYVNSINGKKFYWDFGDNSNTISADSVVTHGYFSNNSSGYTIKVVAIDSNGCTSDTFILNDYIKISGPEPSFSVISKPPCDSGTVYFVNNSKFIYNYYFIYGDNSSTDHDTIKPHFYQFEDFSKDSNTYNPTLYAYDETGCLAFSSVAVKLYRPPIVKIFASDSVGCVPIKVQFSDSTKYALRYKWNFGDGNMDTTYSPSHNFNSASSPGTVYSVTLTAISDKGCSVTSNPILVDAHPDAIPTMNIRAPNIQCYEDTFHFIASANIPVSRYLWNFGDGNINSDTSDLINPAYHYVQSGKHTVQLTAYTKFGCVSKIEDSTTVHNLDSLSPVPPQIDYVTVTKTNQVQIVFAKSLTQKFAYYTLYRYPGPDSIYSTNNQTDTVYFDNPPLINVNAQSYSYTLKLSDVCGFTSGFSIPQHSIYLTVNKSGQNELQLLWNKYTGWNNVASYQIFRLNNQGNFVNIATVGTLDSTYLDTNLCPGKYTYYVNAVNSNGLYFSASDTASNEPDYIYQTSPITLNKATVVSNKYIYIDWTPAVQGNFKLYSIDRYSMGSGWVLNFASSTKPFYIDSSVDVNNMEYAYRVSVADNCGDVSPVSNIATSILLTSVVVNDTRYFSWNEYTNWTRGVSSYHLQIIQNDGSYKDLLVLPSTDTTYFDSASHPDLDVQTCYRVYAVENPDLNGNADSSLSNVTCPYLPPRIFIPNAFSPNNDSVNDVFIPRGLSIIDNTDVQAQKYEFRIYNKWGELLFETNDTRKGWDGKYKGSLVPSDVYIYTVDAQGFNGQRFYLKGNVTLVK